VVGTLTFTRERVEQLARRACFACGTFTKACVGVEEATFGADHGLLAFALTGVWVWLHSVRASDVGEALAAATIWIEELVRQATEVAVAFAGAGVCIEVFAGWTCRCGVGRAFAAT